jgi:tetratricopeptide (TPR) repeat protein
MEPAAPKTIAIYKNALLQIIEQNTNLAEILKQKEILRKMADTVLENDPDDQASNYIKGCILFTLDQHAESIEYLEKAGTLNCSENQNKNEILATAYYHSDEYQKSIPGLEEATQARPYSDEPKIMLINALLKTNAKEEAHNYYKSLCAKDHEELKRYYPEEYAAFKHAFTTPPPSTPDVGTPC